MYNLIVGNVLDGKKKLRRNSDRIRNVCPLGTPWVLVKFIGLWSQLFYTIDQTEMGKKGTFSFIK